MGCTPLLLLALVAVSVPLLRADDAGPGSPSHAHTHSHGKRHPHLHELCFVSSLSENHVGEFRLFLESFKTFYPCSPLYIYDLGLQNESLAKLQSLPLTRVIPLVTKRPYLDMYNGHIFKAIALLQFVDGYDLRHNCRMFFYGDTSVVLSKRVFDSAAFDEVHRLGIVTEASSKWRQMEFTHPLMYTYFGLDREEVYKKEQESNNPLTQIQSGLMLVDTTNQTFRNDFFRRWYLCSIDRDCLHNGTYTNLDVSFKRAHSLKDGTRIFRTNRDDQSAFTFLMDEYFNHGNHSKRSVFLNDYLHVSHRKRGTWNELDAILSKSVTCQHTEVKWNPVYPKEY